MYIFCQLINFLPKRVFDGLVSMYSGGIYVKHFTCWNQLLDFFYLTNNMTRTAEQIALRY